MTTLLIIAIASGVLAFLFLVVPILNRQSVGSQDVASARNWNTVAAPLNLVAGESHYAATLRRFTGRPRERGYLIVKEALMVREPENPHDLNAIKVTIEGKTVGYLRRQIAAILSPQMDGEHLTTFSTSALLRGGYIGRENVGVHLWLEPNAAAKLGLTPKALVELQVPWPPRDDEG